MNPTGTLPIELATRPEQAKLERFTLGLRTGPEKDSHVGIGVMPF